MLAGVVLLIITTVIAIVVILLVGFANNVSKFIRIDFAALCLSLVAWQYTILAADRVDNHLKLWNNLAFFWPTVAAVSCLIFVSSMRSGRLKSMAAVNKTNIFLLASVAGAVVLQLVAIFSNHIFESITLDAESGVYTFVRGWAYPFYIFGMALLLAVILTRMTTDYIRSKKYPQERRAFKIVLVTVIVTIGLALLTNVVIPLATGNQKLIWLGFLPVGIFVVGLAFSIIWYRFLDIRSYVLRSVGYILSILVVALMYMVLAILPLVNFLDLDIGPLALVVLIMTVVLLATSFRSLLTNFNKFTNRIFFRDYYEPQSILDELGSLLVYTVDIREIQARTQNLLTKALQPTELRFVLFRSGGARDVLLRQLSQREANVISLEDMERGSTCDSALCRAMRSEGVALAARLRTTHEDLGYLLFGFRRSGAEYSTADKRFIGMVADQLAVGLQNAMRFEEIEHFNQTLQEKVEDATRQLRRTNDKLRKLDETKDDFISMASHQLRTPLTSVKGYVSMVLDGDAGSISKVQRKLLTQSFISSQRMVYLISDLLNVSRLKTGNFILEPVPSNLAKVVQEEVSQLQETAKGRNLELTYHKPEQFPVLMLDETKLRQVVMNFIDNAVYYTPSGGHITVSLVDKPKTIELTVADDGIGVPRQDQHHLFTKFFRAHNAKRSRPDGTGLGLFMAKKVIVAQGGAVIFKSQEGRGSTFGFSLVKSRLMPPDASKTPPSKPKEK